MDYTTLNRIKEYSPCQDGWKKLLKSLGKTKSDNARLSFKRILDSNGFDDALWALRAHKDENKVRLFTADCAERVLHIFEDQFPDDDRPRKAIQATRDFAEGKIDDATRAAAWAAADAAAWAAADAAAWAARAAVTAAWAARSVAAWAAARADADATAWDAVTAAWAARSAAAWAARADADATAWDAAWDAEEKEQEKIFTKYFC